MIHNYISYISFRIIRMILDGKEADGVWLDGFLDLWFLLRFFVLFDVASLCPQIPFQKELQGRWEATNLSWSQYLSLMTLCFRLCYDLLCHCEIYIMVPGRLITSSWHGHQDCLEMLGHWPANIHSCYYLQFRIRAMGWGIIMDHAVLESSWIWWIWARGQSAKLTETLLFRGKLSPWQAHLKRWRDPDCRQL